MLGELSEGLRKKGFQVEVACLNRNPGKSERLPEEEVIDGVKVKRLPFLDLKYYKFAPGILSQVRRKDIDLVHIHNLGFWTDCILLAKLLGLHDKRVVVSSNGGVFHTSNLGWLKKVYFNLWGKFLFKAADKVIAISKNDFQVFERIVTPPKLVLIEEGINLEKYAALPIKREKNRFIYVGRISENKRIDRLLEAFALSKEEKGLVVVGRDSQNLLPRLKAKARELGLKEVRFTGEISERQLLEEYCQAEFFVSASEFEGFGLSAIEAMASGLVPLLNDIGSFKEFVKENENGFIVDFAEKGEAAKKIDWLCRLKAGEKRRLSGSARKASQRFDWREKIKEFEAVYRQALEGKRPI